MSQSLSLPTREAEPQLQDTLSDQSPEAQISGVPSVTWEPDSSGIYNIPITIAPSQTADASTVPDWESVWGTIISQASSDLSSYLTASDISTITTPSPTTSGVTSTTETSTSIFTSSTSDLTTTTTTASSSSSSTTTSTSTLATNSSTAAPSTTSTGTSTKTKLAIALPISIIGTLILIALVFFFLRRRRQGRRQASPAYEPTRAMSGFSTSDLMVSQPPPAARSAPRFPMLDIPDTADDESGFGTFIEEISPRGDENVQMGFGFSSSSDRHVSGTTQDTRGISRSASLSVLEPNFDDREDAASLVSPVAGQRRDRDDDMSSISSYGDVNRTHDYNIGGSLR